MGKIITFKSLQKEITKVKKSGKKIVLVGGCFDILHIGHIKFLKEAKKLGNLLFILLESDERVRKLKGENKPYFPQEERAQVLTSLNTVDYVIPLPFFENDGNYRSLIQKIKPSIIAVTSNDPIIEKKKYQAKLADGEIAVIPYIKTFSSSKLAKLLGIE